MLARLQPYATRAARRIWPVRDKTAAIEIIGLSAVTLGIALFWPPGAFMFAGAALIFLAQGVN